MFEPLVSIIMPAYNAVETIGSAIRSVLNQKYHNWELLIINDGSIDDTDSVITSFNDERIVIYFQENMGVAAARNLGLLNARGVYISFLDSDDMWANEKLSNQVNLFHKLSEEVGVIYSNAVGFHHGCSYGFNMNSGIKISTGSTYHDLVIMDFVPTLTVMMRSLVIKEIGYFDANLFGTEDWDYWIRISRRFIFVYTDTYNSYYRIKNNSLSRNRIKHAYEELKVINKSRILETLPSKIIHAALLFWTIKKIMSSIKSGNFPIRDILNFILGVLDGRYFSINFKILFWCLRFSSCRYISKRKLNQVAIPGNHE